MSLSNEPPFNPDAVAEVAAELQAAIERALKLREAAKEANSTASSAEIAVTNLRTKLTLLVRDQLDENSCRPRQVGINVNVPKLDGVTLAHITQPGAPDREKMKPAFAIAYAVHRDLDRDTSEDAPATPGCAAVLVCQLPATEVFTEVAISSTVVLDGMGEAQ